MIKPLKIIPHPQGSTPAPFSSLEAGAIQALSTGTANEGQQRRALNWIIEEACGMRYWAYKDSQRETDIALGRHFVGQQIVGLLKINISQLVKREGRGESEHG